MGFYAYDASYSPPLDLINKLTMKSPFKFLLANGWVPFRHEEGKLHILCDDPSDAQKVSDIELMVKDRKYELFIGLQDDIRQLIGKLSGQAATELSDTEFQVSDESDEDAEKPISVKMDLPSARTTSGVIKLVNAIIMEAYNRGVL